MKGVVVSGFITVERTEKGREYWAKRPFVGDLIAGRIRDADLVIVPWEGFRDFDGPVFPVGTESFYTFMKENMPSGSIVEVAVDDDKYTEVALHGALVIVGTVLVTGLGGIALNVISGLITEYVKSRFPKMFVPQASASADRIRVQVIVDSVSGGVLGMTYEGPPQLLESELADVFKKVASGEEVANPESQPTTSLAHPLEVKK